MKYIINGQETQLRFSGKVKDLLRRLEVSDQIVIVKRNGEIITELESVNDDDTIEIQQVVFGG